MRWPTCPCVYEINTWVWLQQLSREAGHVITLGTVPDPELIRLADYGFDALWLMGVWQRSPASRKLAREDKNLEKEYRMVLPDYSPEDVVGSPYAILSYRVDSLLGGDEELDAFRQRLRKFGLRLILDFIPNHFAIDHDWLGDHPERFVQGGHGSLHQAPGHYFAAKNGFVFAHGRDPNLRPWNDTVQLDYRRSDTRQAMMKHLLAVAERCDGIRCDMAMLITRDVFLYTWGGDFDKPGVEFWPEAIQKVKAAHQDCLMMAEVYWDLEPELQQMGFDYTYDKGLYDVLVGDRAVDIRIRLHKSLKYQHRLVRFIENHDERRSVEVFGGVSRSLAIATLVLNLPGMRLFHDGQMEGQCFNPPVQIGRYCRETVDNDIEQFYKRLLLSLRDPVFHDGEWCLLAPQAVRPSDISYNNVVAYQWVLGEDRRIVIVNLSPDVAKCILPLQISGLAGHSWYLRDLLRTTGRICNGDDITIHGLKVEIPAYGYEILAIESLSEIRKQRDLDEKADTWPVGNRGCHGKIVPDCSVTKKRHT